MVMISRASVRAWVVWMILGTWTVAAAGPWTHPSGTGTNFSYSGGRDVAGLFGEPTASDGKITFPTTTLGVSSSGGGSASRTDTVSFDVHVNAGWQLASIQVLAVGTYAVSGNPTLNSASADFALAVSETDADPQEWPGEWAPNPEMPVNGGSGDWYSYGLAAIDLSGASPPPADSVHIELTGHLTAISAIAGTALININPGTGLEINVNTVPIPEPSTLSLLTTAGWFGFRRRR